MWIARAQAPDDAAVAGALIREYGARYEFDFTDPEWLGEIERPLDRYGPPDGMVNIARVDGEPAGVVCLKRLDERTCLMKRMFVRPPFRRRGIGKVLALELLFEAERLGYERMVLDTPEDNIPALTLYRSIGFRDTAPFREPGHDHDHPNWAYLEIAIPPADDRWFANIKTLLETAYLSSDNIYRQSGNPRADPARWEVTRGIVAEAIDRDGTFLDVGCANGLLMESVARWCADKGMKIEPYGVDISEKLAEVARARLPQWADRIFVGNAWEWEPPIRFDFVSTRIEYVPKRLYADYLRRLLAGVVAQGGRLILLGLRRDDTESGPGFEDVHTWGFETGPLLERHDGEGRVVSRAAWIAR